MDYYLKYLKYKKKYLNLKNKYLVSQDMEGGAGAFRKMLGMNSAQIAVTEDKDDGASATHNRMTLRQGVDKVISRSKGRDAPIVPTEQSSGVNDIKTAPPPPPPLQKQQSSAVSFGVNSNQSTKPKTTNFFNVPLPPTFTHRTNVKTQVLNATQQGLVNLAERGTKAVGNLIPSDSKVHFTNIEPVNTHLEPDQKSESPLFYIGNKTPSRANKYVDDKDSKYVDDKDSKESNSIHLSIDRSSHNSEPKSVKTDMSLHNKSNYSNSAHKSDEKKSDRLRVGSSEAISVNTDMSPRRKSESKNSGMSSIQLDFDGKSDTSEVKSVHTVESGRSQTDQSVNPLRTRAQVYP